MSIFNASRLGNQTFKLDIDRMRQGWYSDKYFGNVELLLATLDEQNYLYPAQVASQPQKAIPVGNVEVEVQWFTRRPTAIIVGVDKALAMLRHCTGYFRKEEGQFVETWANLSVEAVHDGDITRYEGDSTQVQPVIRVRGRYRDFANLETPMIGILSRASRIATNVYEVLRAARGKSVLFFPARFDVHEVQAADGYAYDIAVQRFNLDYGQTVRPFISTDAQGDWWGGVGGGTVPHAIIACFLGDTVGAMKAFARTQELSVPRIALVDFQNDVSRTSAEVATAFWGEYRAALERGEEKEAERWKLYGVRLDTSGNMVDGGLSPLGDPALDMGVNPRLVMLVRQTLDNLWTTWGVLGAWEEAAREYCQQIKIVVSGGFDREKIERFERLRIPVDVYGVGSSLMANDRATNTDFTADVVRVRLNGSWVEMAKIGRRPNDNPGLRPVDLGTL
jgi:nicotinate phosphoribosyltransferase